MKRVITFVLVLAMAVSLLAMPAAASTISAYDWNVPHNTPLKHKHYMIMEMTASIDIAKLPPQEKIPETVWKPLIENAEEGLIPEDCKINPDHISMMEAREISCEEEEFFFTIRVWGCNTRPVMFFFKDEGSDEWRLLKCALGKEDMTINFPGNGTYALCTCW